MLGDFTMETLSSIQWHLDSYLHHWSIFYDKRLVASFKTQSILGANGVGIVNETPIQIIYHRRNPNDTALLIDQSTGRIILSMKGVQQLPSRIDFNDHTIYNLDFRGRKRDIVITNSDGLEICVTKYNFNLKKMGFTFSILNWKPGDSNIWILALVSLYIGINHSS